MTQMLSQRIHEPFPLYPPADWFTKPTWLEPGQKLTVVTDGDEAGRVAGYVAPFGECILDGKPGCWTVPSSPTKYAGAHQGETVTADGQTIRTANIGGGINHARLSDTFQGAVNHYSNTASQLMRVVYGEDAYGVWAAGALWPDVTERDLAMVRASALSGDWRYRPELGAIDMTGSQLVNDPGFPLIRQMSRAAALPDFPGDIALSITDVVYVGGLGGAGEVEPDVSMDLLARVADLQKVAPDELDAHLAALEDQIALRST